jgi:hypothetical protein
MAIAKVFHNFDGETFSEIAFDFETKKEPCGIIVWVTLPKMEFKPDDLKWDLTIALSEVLSVDSSDIIKIYY